MLDLARRQAARLPRAVTLHQGDAAALPFPAESFDTVVSTFALCCIPDDRGALLEALRALQHVADLVSVPLQGEHFTRRPLDTLRDLDVTVAATERLKWGAIEHVHARKPT